MRLRATNISKAYSGETVLSLESFECDTGETRCIIGHNGSGKSTLLSLIAGLQLPSAGSIFLEGRDITNIPPSARAKLGVATSMQTARPVVALTVLENVVLALAHRRSPIWLATHVSPHPDDASKAEAILAALGLRGRLQTSAGVLNLSERKRLELACAMVQEPRLLLLDEPTAGLSNEDAQMLVPVLRRASPSTAVVIVEHNLGFIELFDAMVVVLDRGRQVGCGRTGSAQLASLLASYYLK